MSLASILLYPLLLLPPSIFTPVHHIEIEHFGHWVDTTLYDAAVDRVGLGTGLDGHIKVQQLTEYVTDETCTREVEWASVRSSFPTETSDFTIVINPHYIGTPEFPTILDAAILATFQQLFGWHPVALLSESCVGE